MKKSSVCIWLAFVVIALFSLFPPWVDNHNGTHHKLWHAPINRPPEDAAVPMVDYPRMFTEIAVGECFVLALYLTLGRNEPPPF